jgi:hypothetical protein
LYSLFWSSAFTPSCMRAVSGKCVHF